MTLLVVYKNMAIRYSIVDSVGDTVYLPYGWLHCVITVNIHSVCASLLSVGFKIPKKRREDVWKVMTSAIAVEGSRDKKKKGPVSCLNQ